MRHSRGLGIAVASVLLVSAMLTGCASAKEQAKRAQYDAMLRVDGVPGVIVASYANWVQVDPAAPEEEIVSTLLAVRDIIVDAGFDDVTFVAVYPGDAFTDTQFTSRVLKGEQFQRDARIWAGLLDSGLTEVRYNVFDDTGDGVLSVGYDNPGVPGPTTSEAFETMVGALGGSPESHAGLQTEALIGRSLATNSTGSLSLPPGWPKVLDAVNGMDFLSSSNAQITPKGTFLNLYGPSALTPDQSAGIMVLLTDSGVLQAGVTVAYSPRDGSPIARLFGATP